jgi:hypothetical protein
MAANGKAVLDKGGIIIEVMAHGETRANMDAWITTYKLPITTVRDPDNMQNQTLDALVLREYNYIVDLATMKIVDRMSGSTAGIGAPATTAGMNKMLQLLN